MTWREQGIVILEKSVMLGEGRRLPSGGQGRWEETLFGNWGSIARGMIRSLNNRGQVGAHGLETKLEAMIIASKVRVGSQRA